MSEPRFMWVGAARDLSGHADELRGFLRAQERAGDEPVLHELSWTDRRAPLGPSEEASLRRQSKRDPAAADIAVHSYLPLAGQPDVTGIVNVARAMFETDRLPGSWLAPLLARNEVWVPCRQNFEAFVDSGLPASKLRIVGGTLDFDLFTPGAEPYDLGAERGRFAFLTNFDFSARKGWEVLLRAWIDAFDADDGVCLVLKTGSFYREDGYVEQRITDFLRREAGARVSSIAPVHLLTDRLAVRDMPRLYAAADAYVLASRGEGWGRPFMEAQAMGLPTIASAWGGQREFMDADTSWLVEGELVPVPDDAELFNGLYRGHRWFEPDADSLAAQMRAIAADPGAARARAARARSRLVARFGTDATAAWLRECGAAAVERFASPGRPRAVIRGGFGSTASLATVNDGLADALEAAGHVIHHRAPGSEIVRDPGVGIAHAWPHDFAPVTDGPTVVVLPWEFGPPPAEWVAEARARADRVWVPSRYVRDGFLAGGMPAGIVEVVPNGVDLHRFTADGDRLELPVRASCVFLFVGGTVWRKGVDRLTAAWAEAFAPGDDVALVIKDFGATTWYRGQTAQDALRSFGARTDIAPVHYLGEDVPAAALPALYRAADVLVAPYRGEGFCLPALEAMACGLPVIHTATGPTGEFVPPHAGWALPAREVTVDSPGLPLTLTAPAAVQEVDHGALVAALRDAAADGDGRRARAETAVAAAGRHAWSAVARAATRSLATLAEEALPLARDARPELIGAPEGRTLVVFAPRWTGDATWADVLALWARSFGEDDPVTLALPAAGADPDALLPVVLDRLADRGVDIDALPDIMLCRPEVRLCDLVARADAVLVGDADGGRPELVRRALRVLAADEAGIAAVRDLLGAPEADAVLAGAIG